MTLTSSSVRHHEMVAQHRLSNKSGRVRSHTLSCYSLLVLPPPALSLFWGLSRVVVQGEGRVTLWTSGQLAAAPHPWTNNRSTTRTYGLTLMHLDSAKKRKNPQGTLADTQGTCTRHTERTRAVATRNLLILSTNFQASLKFSPSSCESVRQRCAAPVT